MVVFSNMLFIAPALHYSSTPKKLLIETICKLIRHDFYPSLIIGRNNLRTYTIIPLGMKSTTSMVSMP